MGSFFVGPFVAGGRRRTRPPSGGRNRPFRFGLPRGGCAHGLPQLGSTQLHQRVTQRASVRHATARSAPGASVSGAGLRFQVRDGPLPRSYDSPRDRAVVVALGDQHLRPVAVARDRLAPELGATLHLHVIRAVDRPYHDPGLARQVALDGRLGLGGVDMRLAACRESCRAEARQHQRRCEPRPHRAPLALAVLALGIGARLTHARADRLDLAVAACSRWLGRLRHSGLGTRISRGRPRLGPPGPPCRRQPARPVAGEQHAQSDQPQRQHEQPEPQHERRAERDPRALP